MISEIPLKEGNQTTKPDRGKWYKPKLEEKRDIFYAAISGIAFIALSIVSLAFGAGQYVAGGTLFVAVASSTGGIVISVVLALMFYQVLKS